MSSCPICQDIVPTAALGEHVDECHPVATLYRDKTQDYQQLRAQHILQKSLEIHRLETRLGNLLTQLDAIEAQHQGYRRIMAESARKQAEQQLVHWDPPESVDRCRICQLKFSYFSRKHHCRVCGRVVCGDVDRECSMEVDSKLLGTKLHKPVQHVFSVRICCDCRDTVFGHQNFVQDCTQRPATVKQWAALRRRKEQVEALLPQFQSLVEQLATGSKDPEVLASTKKTRTQLYTSIGQFDALTKRLLESSSNATATEERLARMMLVWATEFLQAAMAPLQAVPQVMQSTEEPRMRKDEALKAQNVMVVLQEQLFMVEQMIDNAKKRRKFDELPPLEQSMRELKREIEQMSLELGSLAPK